MKPNAPDPWREVSAARVPLDGLAALAPVRHRGDVRVLTADGCAWVRWPAGEAAVARSLVPVPGVAFFTHRGGTWFPLGRSVPAGDAPPDGEGVSVSAVLVPARFTPVPPGAAEWAPVPLTVVRGGPVQAPTALACPAGALARWADVATTAELAAVRAARCGGRALLLGSRLPPLPGTTRYWGTDVFVPLGFRPDPELPEGALREAAGASHDEFLLLDETGAELIPRTAFEPLTRAGARLGARIA
ncbi:hypothetical protein R5W24_005054 [Gemmata sp. JC717]|uniref:hypothetical protein n=1 Tax=Gemmata algarum TaxID=2975278 RepID=UPI0021BA8BD4|nr:hypothetical protein [Gemmata algarum]MDY3555908.1 hypothetical protein [Gemmata algarum]